MNRLSYFHQFMSKRSSSCSDIRGVPKITSNRGQDSRAVVPRRPQELTKANYFCAQNSGYESLPVISTYKINEVDIPSYRPRNIFSAKKNQSFSRVVNTLLQNGNGTKKQQRKVVPTLGRIETTTNTKRPATSKMTTRRPRIGKTKPVPYHIGNNDIEYMREVIRIDKGLPTTKEERRISIDVFQSPEVLPRPNRLSRSRYQFVRASFPRLDKFRSSHKRFSSDLAMKPAEEIWEEEELRRLRELAASVKKTEDPSYKFNRVFTLRYQHNKGNPAIPDSFRQSYKRYHKPLFHMVRELQLPRRYLLPEFKKDEVSLLGLANDPIIPLTAQKTKKLENSYFKSKRKPVPKRGRIVRLVNVNPTATGSKIPWNYGRFSCPRSI